MKKTYVRNASSLDTVASAAAVTMMKIKPNATFSTRVYIQYIVIFVIRISLLGVALSII